MWNYEQYPFFYAHQLLPFSLSPFSIIVIITHMREINNKHVNKNSNFLTMSSYVTFCDHLVGLYGTAYKLMRLRVWIDAHLYALQVNAFSTQ